MATATIEAPASGPGSVHSSLHRSARSRKARDRLATLVVLLCLLLAMIPLAWILWTVLSRGAGLLGDAHWWTNSQRGITARRVGGGAYHAIVGTLLMALVTAVISVPIALGTAIYLVEYGRGTFARAVTFMVDVLTGIPSIVAALFVYALWVTTFGFQRVAFAVSLALVLLMIPVVVRSTEEMLRLVPRDLREASYALGVPRWKTIVKVVLPTAFSGIVTGIMLGLARVMGETAPLLILGPYTTSINMNIFHGNMAALPTFINQDRNQALQPALDRVWSAALTLIIIVMVLSLAGRAVSRLGSVKK
ncbi:MAG: phosphate transport system permease protein [Actinomycetota bacterium]|nr:phosphate transport system permease protein [Actinomycetota bacterium]